MFRARVLVVAALLAIPLGAASGRASAPSLIVFSADRAPSVSGEIYRLDPNGRRVDLSRSAYQDTRPLVSPDGRTVAFLSQRGRFVSVYEMGIDGRGLVRVGPSLSPQGQYPYLAWQPGGRRLALTGGGSDRSPQTSLWILQAGHRPIRVHGSERSIQPSWSPDGRVLLTFIGGPTFAGGHSTAFSPSGRRLFTVPGSSPFSSWSSSDLLATRAGDGVGVYDESGRLRLKVPGQVSGGPVWSPDGRFLAAIVARKLEVVTSTGGVILRKPLSGRHGLVWNENGRVVLGGFGRFGDQQKSVDIRTGSVSSASDRWFAPLSADGKLAAVTSKHGIGFTIQVAPTAGGAGKTYSRVPGCYDYAALIAAVESLQFAGPSKSLVYASYCPEPFSRLYAETPGGQPREITGAQPYATDPALSPDLARIAYSWARFTGLSCGGCASQIRLVGADGTGERVFTQPPDCTYDVSPTWSPNGAMILYSQSDCNTPPELYTIPAGGGASHDLHVAGDNPAWGPARIAYVNRNQAGGVWTANPDGSDQVRVAKTGTSPAWSTDGRLAYLQGTTVVVGSTQVSLPFAQVTSLAWSPDGTRFVVTARNKDAAVPDLYIVNTDGSDPVRLTTNYDASGASWR